MKQFYWNNSDVAGTLTYKNADGSQRMPDREHFHGIIAERERERVTA